MTYEREMSSSSGIGGIHIGLVCIGFVVMDLVES